LRVTHSSNLFPIHFRSFSVTFFAISAGLLNEYVSTSFPGFHCAFFPSDGGRRNSIFIEVLLVVFFVVDFGFNPSPFGYFLWKRKARHYFLDLISITYS